MVEINDLTYEYLDNLNEGKLRLLLYSLGYEYLEIKEYKNHTANIEHCNNIYFGKINNISDLVTFQTDDYSKIEEEFKNAVDDYIEFCKEVGKEINFKEDLICSKVLHF